MVSYPGIRYCSPPTGLPPAMVWECVADAGKSVGWVDRMPPKNNAPISRSPSMYVRSFMCDVPFFSCLLIPSFQCVRSNTSISRTPSRNVRRIMSHAHFVGRQAHLHSSGLSVPSTRPKIVTETLRTWCDQGNCRLSNNLACKGFW